LFESKNILVIAKSLPDRIIGSMRLCESQHIIFIVKEYHKQFAEQQSSAAISYSFSYFDSLALNP